MLTTDFRVHRTERLRVVDASVFPRTPGLFIVSAVYMIAEKAADVMIAAARAHATLRTGDVRIRRRYGSRNRWRERSLEESGKRCTACGANRGDLDHQVVGQAVSVRIGRRGRAPRVPVGHEELRMIERRAAVKDALVGQGLHERDKSLDFRECERRNTERLDHGAVKSLDRRHVSPRLYSSTTSFSVRASPL